MNRARTLAVSLMLLAFAATANASWYDDYDAGVDAARAGKWSTVVAKMTAAIKGNAKESNSARTYGAIFINYHPYYYRGIANLNLGNYEQAISDLEKTQGPGELDLGPIGSHLERAKTKLAAASAPEPEPARPEPVRPTPTVPVPTPAVPQIDSALRTRASQALGAAKQKIQSAQARKATGSQQYAQALSMYTDATTRNAAAKTNDDLTAVITIAENAADLADLAAAPAVVTAPTPVAPAPITPTKPTVATTLVLAEAQREVRRALENYFAGEFDLATQQFQRLANAMPSNGWIWAFLGASQYSQYAFEADESYRDAAIKSFRKAKQYRKWKDGLPSQYFSKRIRRAFEREG